ncbi:MAG TPA: hypothetical protein VH912_23765 [Streptosporangiaceae bacterium]
MQTPSTTVRRRICSVVAAVGAAVLLTQTTAAAATPKLPGRTGILLQSPGADSFDKLTAQINKLEKQYGGELAQLRDAQFGLKRAYDKSRRLKAELGDAQALVAQIAASHYMNSGVEPEVAILASGDPSDVMDGAALAQHLAQSKAARVQQIQGLMAQQQEAQQTLQAKVAAFKRSVGKLESQKARVKKLLDKFRPSSPVIGGSGLTARMVKVRNEIDSRFGPFQAIGCLRPGDPQDHGTGHACDFMLTTGGTMATGAAKTKGDTVAQWVIDNASRLGVKYVIWRQRIYDMRSPGWDPMENRGSVTANHYDHVHVSVF